MDEEEDTKLPEENQEVDPSITLCHKIFLLSNPDLCDDVNALGEEHHEGSSHRSGHPAGPRDGILNLPGFGGGFMAWVSGVWCWCVDGSTSPLSRWVGFCP